MRHFSPSTPSRSAGSLAALGLLLATAGAAQAQTPASFAVANNYPAGVTPHGITAADVNGDGRIDIVTANYWGGTVGVLRQTIAGFVDTNYTIIDANSHPASVVVADVNGDGRPDIVTANEGNGTAGVLLGLASGSFGPVSTYSAGNYANPYANPAGVAVADMNGDGRPDIVTANTGNSTAGVLLGLAGGGFGPVSIYSAGANSRPLGVAVADVNGDGQLDIVTANANSDTAGVLLGQAGGGFIAVSTYSTGFISHPAGLAVADVNGDGQPDIVTANLYSNTAGVLLGLAGGGFGSVSLYSTGVYGQPSGVVVADVNGDGRLDIVTANSSTSMAGVLLGMAGGGFATVSAYPTGANPTGVAVADVNGDGRLDIVTANHGGNTAGVLLNTGTFAPLAATPSAAAPAEVTLFPNPAHNGFTVQLPAAWRAAAVRAELLNALGQVVRQQEAARPAGPQLTVETAGLNVGIYTLRLHAGGHTLAKRVAVE